MSCWLHAGAPSQFGRKLGLALLFLAVCAQSAEVQVDWTWGMTPSVKKVNCGDILRFVWSSGSHNVVEVKPAALHPGESRHVKMKVRLQADIIAVRGGCNETYSSFVVVHECIPLHVALTVLGIKISFVDTDPT